MPEQENSLGAQSSQTKISRTAHDQSVNATPLFHRKLSEVLNDIALNYRDKDATLGEILDRLGEQSFGLAIILFSLPNAIIPGISFILGAPVVIFALQMAFGYERVTLPRLLGRKKISSSLLQNILHKTIRFLVFAEKRSRMRWTWFASKKIQPVLALYIAVAALFLMMPIPFGNALPSIGISMISVGTIQKDGKAAAIGIMLCLLGMLYIVLAVFLGVEGLLILKNHIF